VNPADQNPDTPAVRTKRQPTEWPESSENKRSRGVRALKSDEFNALDSVGGIRGLVESVLPGLAYLVLFIATRDLTVALIGSLSIAAVMVIARLIQRTPVTMAFSGIFGVAIGLYVAWKSGDAQDFYVWGLLVNAAYLLGMLVTILIRWPGVGVLVEVLRSGLGAQGTSKIADDSAAASATSPSVVDSQEEHTPVEQKNTEQVVFPTAWRKDKKLYAAYTTVTWMWIGMFAARIVVQLPLYLAGEDYIAALGTARLVMGVPLFALVLWLSWRIIRQSTHSANPQV
jgi:hypothetical protein